MWTAFVTVPAWFVLVAVGALFVGIGGGWMTASYATRKGFPFFPVFLACFVLPFPVVLLVVALTPPRSGPPQRYY